MGGTATGPWTAYQQADNAGGTTQAPTGPWTAYQQANAGASANAAPSSLVGPTMSGVVAAPNLLPDAKRLFGPTVGGVASLGRGVGHALAHPIDTVEGVPREAAALGQSYWHSIEQPAHEAAKSWANGHYLRAMGYFALGMDHAAGGAALKAAVADPLLHAGAQIESGNIRAGVENFIGTAGNDALMALGGGEEDSAAEIAAQAARKDIAHVNEIAADMSEGGAAARVHDALKIAQEDARTEGYSVVLGNGKQGEYVPITEDTDLTKKTFYHGGRAERITDLDGARASARGLAGPGSYITDDPRVAQSYAGKSGRVVSGYFKKAPKLLDGDAPADEETLADLNSVAASLDTAHPTTFPKGTSPIAAIGRLQQEMRDAGFTSDEASDKLENLYAHLADRGYDGIVYEGGARRPILDEKGNPIKHNAIALFQTKQDREIANLMRASVKPDMGTLGITVDQDTGKPVAGLRVPVTAKIARQEAGENATFSQKLGAATANILGSSFFGAPIARVRAVQDALGQRLFEAMLQTHVANISPSDFVHSPILMGKAVATRIFANASKLYQGLLQAGRDVEVQVPLEAAEASNRVLDPQAQIDRLAAYSAGMPPSDMEFQGHPLQVAMAIRSRAAAIARTAANDADAFRAGQHVRALDAAIEGALRRNLGEQFARNYRQASELWHDGWAIDRQVSKIGKINDADAAQLEPGQAAFARHSIPWKWSSVLSVLKDPANESDLLRLFQGPENLNTFRQFADLAVKDGGAINRLAAGVGSLFLGNYPLYRAVWGISSANPSYLGTTGVMLAGYRIMAQLAVQPAGVTLMKDLAAAASGTQDAIRLGYALSLAAKLQRGGALPGRTPAAAAPNAAPPRPRMAYSGRP